MLDPKRASKEIYSREESKSKFLVQKEQDLDRFLTIPFVWNICHLFYDQNAGLNLSSLSKIKEVFFLSSVFSSSFDFARALSSWPQVNGRGTHSIFLFCNRIQFASCNWCCVVDIRKNLLNLMHACCELGIPNLADIYVLVSCAYVRTFDE